MARDFNALMEAASDSPGHFVPVADYNTRSTANTIRASLKDRYPLPNWDMMVRREGDRFVLYARFLPIIEEPNRKLRLVPSWE